MQKNRVKHINNAFYLILGILLEIFGVWTSFYFYRILDFLFRSLIFSVITKLWQFWHTHDRNSSMVI